MGMTELNRRTSAVVETADGQLLEFKEDMDELEVFCLNSKENTGRFTVAVSLLNERGKEIARKHSDDLSPGEIANWVKFEGSRIASEAPRVRDLASEQQTKITRLRRHGNEVRRKS